MIETIIHQIWIQGGDKIPDKFKKNISKIKQLHPNWKYIIWDNDSITNMLKMNKIWIRTYNNLVYLHQKADYARYVILYVFGGVYIDIDAVTVKPLDGLLKQYQNSELIVSKLQINVVESNICCQSNECINNGIIICKKGNELMKIIIDYINTNYKCDKWYQYNKIVCINSTTGPKIFNKLIYNNINNHKVTILDAEYLEACTGTTCNITPNTYVVHKHERTWFNGPVNSLTKMYIYVFKSKNCYWIMYLLIAILIYYCVCNPKIVQ